jgi:hypothetical protein
MKAKIGDSDKRIKSTDHKRNEEFLGEFKVEPVDGKLRRYKSNWLQHTTRTNNKKMTNIMLKYRTSRRRQIARPLKRKLDKAERGLLRPNLR